MDEKEPTEAKEPKTNTERLALLKSRLTVAKAFSKKPHEAMKKWISEYEIDNFGDTDEIRDKVRIGYVFRKTESELPAIFDDQPDLFIKGRSRTVRDIEPLITGTYDYLWDVQNLEEKIEDAGLYFSLLGMGFIESPYVTKTKKVPQPVIDPMTGQPAIDPETGEPQMQMYEVPIVDNPMAEAVDPFKLHFSPETKFSPIMDAEHCPYYFKELTMTKEEVFAKFGVEIDPDEVMKTDDHDTDNAINTDKEILEDDMKRVKVYQYYGVLPEEHAPDGSQWEYDKEYRIFMTMNEELEVTECPYDSKPLFLLGNYGMANKFWKFGDAKHLMPLIQEYEMYRSQVLTHTRKTANPKPLLPAATGIDEDAFMDPRAGRPVKYDGPLPPTYLAPPALGAEVRAGIEMVQSDLEKTSPSFDLGNGSSQSQVKTPRGIQVYSEAADKSVRRKRKKVSRLIRQIIIFQFKQIAQNWKPEDEHTIQVIDGGETQDVKVTQEVLQILGMPQILNALDIEIESLSINRAQQKQDALDLFDLASQHPDIFNLPEVAKDLLQNGFNKKDADRFLLSDQERQQMSQQNKEPAKVSVSVKADSQTPIGATLLENEGLIDPGQANQIMASNQAVANIQNQQLLDPNATTQPQPGQTIQPGDQGPSGGTSMGNP